MSDQDTRQQLLCDLISTAKKKGAEAADAIFIEGNSLSVAWRNGCIDTLEQAEGADLGLRILIGKKQASCSTSDTSPKALEEVVERTISMAKAAPEDLYCGLADESEITHDFTPLDLADQFDVHAPMLIERAKEMEEAVLSVEGVSQCEQAGASASKTNVYLAASNGFSGTYQRTSYSIGASAVAGQGTGMESDHDYAQCTHLNDLPQAALIGQKAGEKAIKNLNARKMPSCRVPVVFDPEESSGFVGTLAGAISGSSVARGTSFLKDSMEKQIFSKEFNIIDDPYRTRGLRSRLFDGEGICPAKRNVIENGVLKTWLMDLRSARQLGLKSTGHASRGTSGVPSPSPSNLYLEAGSLSPQELMADITSGFYVTETMGMGVNGITGDYSLAARGFWIEDGGVSFPVYEMTIAGNLKSMFMNMTAANDLTFKQGIDAPTIRIEGMTVAGS